MTDQEGLTFGALVPRFDSLVEDCRNFFRASSVVETGNWKEARTLLSCKEVVDRRIKVPAHALMLLGEIASRELVMPEDEQLAEALSGSGDWLELFRRLIFQAVLVELASDEKLKSISEARSSEHNL